jgi:hypothetical protein
LNVFCFPYFPEKKERDILAAGVVGVKYFEMKEDGGVEKREEVEERARKRKE